MNQTARFTTENRQQYERRLEEAFKMASQTEDGKVFVYKPK